MDTKIDFKDPAYYENRELSWIKFDQRVLSEARDKSIPLLERLKFVSITSSNLDEFFMVRVASLKDMVHAKYKKRDIAGMTATEQLSAINKQARELVNIQYSTFSRSLMPLLRKEGIYLLDAHEDLNEEQARFVDRYFMENVYPVLTPMAVDASRPFPLIRNKTLNIAALLTGKKTEDETVFATVQVPSVLPRLVQIPSEGETKSFILLEQIIERNIGILFSNYKVLCAYPYRIMRNADLTIDEDEASDLLKEIENKLKMRQWGEVIRLEIEEKVDKKLLKFLKTELKVSDEDIFQIAGPIDLTFLMKMYGIDGYDHLRYKPYTPQQVPEITPGSDIFAAIRKGDIFLHHPYETFDPVVDFIRQASKDPDVLAIKQTLYRVSGNSPIISSLAQAAEKTGARLVHVSTDYVFSGRENGGVAQDEATIPGPISAYGSTKLMGEKYVEQFCHRHFIVRTAWLYSYYGKNFVKTIVNAGKKFGKLEVVNDQCGNPTNAVDLAHEILQLCVTHEYGLYHCTGEGICSWYDLSLIHI